MERRTRLNGLCQPHQYFIFTIFRPPPLVGLDLYLLTLWVISKTPPPRTSTLPSLSPFPFFFTAAVVVVAAVYDDYLRISNKWQLSQRHRPCQNIRHTKKSSSSHRQKQRMDLAQPQPHLLLRLPTASAPQTSMPHLLVDRAVHPFLLLQALGRA